MPAALFTIGMLNFFMTGGLSGFLTEAAAQGRPGFALAFLGLMILNIAAGANCMRVANKISRGSR